VIKSLAYFDDADEQEIPFMFRNTSWQTMKNNIKKHWLIIYYLEENLTTSFHLFNQKPCNSGI
jgi:hypothetical protein